MMNKLLAVIVVLGLVGYANAALNLSENFDARDVLGVGGWNNLSFFVDSTGLYPANPDGPAGNYGCTVPNQDDYRLGHALSGSVEPIVTVEWTSWQAAGTTRMHYLSLVDDGGSGLSFLIRMALRDTIPVADRYLRGGVSTTDTTGGSYVTLQTWQTGTGGTYAYFDTFVNKYVWNQTTGDVSYYRNESLIGSTNVGTGISSPTRLIIWGEYGYNVNAGIDDLTVTSVPEPVSMALLGFGGLGLLMRRKR